MDLQSLYSFICDSLISSVVVVFVLIIWNETNAFVEYCRLLGFSLEGYKIQEQAGIPFTDYLMSAYHEKFLVRLICCPICLSVWLSGLAAYLFENFLIFFLCFYLSLFLYFKLKSIIKSSDI